MPAISRLASIPLRIGELGFAAVVMGIMGSYFHELQVKQKLWPQTRFIYIEVIAGVSLVLGLIWVLPFAGSFFHWPVDIILAFAWFTAFGLLEDYAKGPAVKCGGFPIGNNSSNSSDTAFGGPAVAGRLVKHSAFSACFWLVSGLLGIWFLSRTRKEKEVGGTPNTSA